MNGGSDEAHWHAHTRGHPRGLPEVVGTVQKVHCSWRRLLRRGLEFHVCTINGDRSRGWPDGSLFDSYYTKGATTLLGLLHFTLDTYLIILSVKQGGIKYHFLSLWYDSTWAWIQVSQAIGEHSNLHANIRWSKVSDHSRGRPEGSLFNSYYTEVLGNGSFHWITSFYPWLVPYIAECEAKKYQVPFKKFLVWLDLGLNPGLSYHWRTLYPLDQWVGWCLISSMNLNSPFFESAGHLFPDFTILHSTRTYLNFLFNPIYNKHHKHRPSLATFPNRSSPLAGLLDYIPYPHIVAECMFVLVVLLLLGHMRGSIRVHHLWVRFCLSSSVLHVWFV